MARISLTPHLAQVAPREPGAFAGETAGAAIEALCAAYPALKSYIADEQGRLRKHIALFIDGEHLHGEEALARRVEHGTHIYIFQALSGG